MSCSRRAKSLVRQTDGKRQHASLMTAEKSSGVTRSASRSLSARRDMTGLMPPISSAANMNSRAVSPRSHKGSIRFARSALARRERAGETAQRSVGACLVPVIKAGIREFLLVEHGDDRGEDRGHPQHHGKAALESDAAERGERNDHGHTQAEARDHLR